MLQNYLHPGRKEGLFGEWANIVKENSLIKAYILNRKVFFSVASVQG